MSTTEIVIGASLKFIAIWGSLVVVGLPIAKILIEVTYEIWRDR